MSRRSTLHIKYPAGVAKAHTQAIPRHLLQNKPLKPPHAYAGTRHMTQTLQVTAALSTLAVMDMHWYWKAHASK
jgi:hypothetical protein